MNPGNAILTPVLNLVLGLNGRPVQYLVAVETKPGQGNVSQRIEGLKSSTVMETPFRVRFVIFMK